MPHADRETEQTETGKEIQASVDRAQLALNRLDDVCKRQAKSGHNPPETGAYWDALLDVDMAVLDAFSRIRKFLRVDRDEYWNTYVIGFDGGDPVVLGSPVDDIDTDDLHFYGRLAEPDAYTVDDLRYLEAYQGAYKTLTVTERERFGDKQEVTKVVPNVLDPDDYRRAERVIDEARRKLGFTPTPTESTPRTEITREMIDEVEEWRQQNLPDKYLADAEVENGDS